MAVSQAKQNILKKIREALAHPVPLPFPHSEGSRSPFEMPDEDDTVAFATRFTALQGKFSFCENDKELVEGLTELFKSRGWDKIHLHGDKLMRLFNGRMQSFTDLAACDASVTFCECLVARTGTIVVSAREGGRAASAYAPVHICVAYSDQLFSDLKDALTFLKKKYPGGLPSSVHFATGPSRTADIEKTLVTGVHGPKEVYCFLVDNR